MSMSIEWSSWLKTLATLCFTRDPFLHALVIYNLVVAVSIAFIVSDGKQFRAQKHHDVTEWMRDNEREREDEGETNIQTNKHQTNLNTVIQFYREFYYYMQSRRPTRFCLCLTTSALSSLTSRMVNPLN